MRSLAETAPFVADQVVRGWTDSSRSRSTACILRWPSAGGREPSQPAFAEFRTRDRATSGCRPCRAIARIPREMPSKREAAGVKIVDEAGLCVDSRRIRRLAVSHRISRGWVGAHRNS